MAPLSRRLRRLRQRSRIAAQRRLAANAGVRRGEALRGREVESLECGWVIDVLPSWPTSPLQRSIPVASIPRASSELPLPNLSPPPPPPQLSRARSAGAKGSQAPPQSTSELRPPEVSSVEAVAMSSKEHKTQAAEGIPDEFVHIRKYLEGAATTCSLRRREKADSRRYFGDSERSMRTDDGYLTKFGAKSSCVVCCKPGHKAHECQEARCYICYQVGHTTSTCTNKTKCSACGRRGHQAEGCLYQALKEAARWKSQRGVRCARCGEEGHAMCGTPPPRRRDAAVVEEEAAAKAKAARKAQRFGAALVGRPGSLAHRDGDNVDARSGHSGSSGVRSGHGPGRRGGASPGRGGGVAESCSDQSIGKSSSGRGWGGSGRGWGSGGRGRGAVDKLESSTKSWESNSRRNGSNGGWQHRDEDAENALNVRDALRAKLAKQQGRSGAAAGSSGNSSRAGSRHRRAAPDDSGDGKQSRSGKRARF
eukprot:TRINITY_DN30931_c0_g1_i1.p1 TRINITY_DN30931_c0_g1~~TRINITY_DN30931_c0_g1_i1.p1  ORF type:complete len:492 (-),score=54.93 TRINITY_DN30931_c0_g1_i1:87-1523(-)